MSDGDPEAMGSDPLPGYHPTIQAADADRIRRWHESAYAAGKADGGATRNFTYLGLTLVVPPSVMPITGVSQLLGEAVLAEVREGDRVLDMGTGSGVNAILAASKGAEVVAVDINPEAVATARANAQRNGVTVEVRESDLFSHVNGRFDLVIFDPPFRWFAPRDLFEAAMTDENYRSLTTFFRTIREHLAEGGRMLVFFGTSGDLGYLRHLIDDEGFSTDIVAQKELIRDDWSVEYFTFRITT
jgi:release factor glutamine methyltransferase